MKKNHLVQISFILLIVLGVGSCSKQKEKETKTANSTEEIPSYVQPEGRCPIGQHPVITFDIDQFNFHKPRTNCTSGFGLCIRGTWGYKCVDDRQTYYSAITADGVAHIWAQVLRGGLLELHFPIDLVNTPGYTLDDLSNFSVDDEWDMSPEPNNPLIMEVGEYKTSFTEHEIIVIVPIKP